MRGDLDAVLNSCDITCLGHIMTRMSPPNGNVIAESAARGRAMCHLREVERGLAQDQSCQELRIVDGGINRHRLRTRNRHIVVTRRRTFEGDLPSASV